MKTFLVSLLLFAFAQGAHALPVELNEWHSKKLYNILAGFGLRTPNPPAMQTLEYAKPAICLKLLNSGTHYTCAVHDELHNTNVEKSGALAKKLYDYLKWANGEQCEGPKCYARSPAVQCIYWWPNKDNPPPRRYACVIYRIPSLTAETF